MKNQERETLIKEYISAYNDMKVEKMPSPLHSELIFENFSGDENTHFWLEKKHLKIKLWKHWGIFQKEINPY